ncbi:MAG TPA: hypothetical protein VMF65_21125 [Acidimicrobiales bacterium]|nr:hypothetical protein [Acidimicrobiales bacterium]
MADRWSRRLIALYREDNQSAAIHWIGRVPVMTRRYITEVAKFATRPVAVMAALAGLGFLVAACGGGAAHGGVAGVGHGKTSTTNSASSFNSGPLEYSVCMRKHGVPDFPDPTRNGSLNIAGTAGASAPVFQAAQQACGKYLSGHVPPGSVSASYLKHMLVAAECLRAHGLPDFPDPTTKPPPGPPPPGVAVLTLGGVSFVIPSSINTQSPLFARAVAACHLGRDWP